MPTLSLVVPLYNEEIRVRETGRELVEFVARCRAGSELIFVDDGSTDRTVSEVEKLSGDAGMPVRILRRPHAGKGAAVQAGLAEARAEYAGFTDVDLSTPMPEFQAIFTAAVMSPVLTVGSRDLAASLLLKPQGRVRELLGKSYNRVVQVTLLPGIADTQCGAKVAATAIWKAILPWCKEEGFSWDVEALAVARRLGIPVRQVAIEWRHDDRSRVNVGRDGLKMVLAVPSIWRRVGRLPTASLSRGVFEDAQAATLIESDSQHWWFQSKAALASSALRRHLRRSDHDARLVDVGAGAGGVTALLGWRADRVYAIEGSETLCRYGSDRHSLFAIAGLGDRMPLRDGSARVVTALDVLEHLESPEKVLDEAWRVLDDGGLLVVNVPAHQWLWSGADELLGHVRRYTRPLLREQVEGSGFQVLWMSHVFSWLLVPVWLRRRVTRDRHKQLGLDDTSPFIDGAATVLTAIERRLVRVLPLPFGTSIMAVMAKNGQGTQLPFHASSASAPMSVGATTR